MVQNLLIPCARNLRFSYIIILVVFSLFTRKFFCLTLPEVGNATADLCPVLVSTTERFSVYLARLLLKR